MSSVFLFLTIAQNTKMVPYIFSAIQFTNGETCDILILRRKNIGREKKLIKIRITFVHKEMKARYKVTKIGIDADIVIES